MEEQPVDVIRESARSALTINRRAHRDEETDSRRHIDNRNVTEAVITDIANRLKNKSAVSVSELRALKNGLLDNPHHIELVLGTQFAVRGLVRELTGQDASRQCIAAGCLCNLALGDSRACAALAKAAGPYLVTSLDSLNTELVVTCAWALGNAAGSGARAASLLTSQGAVARLAALLTSSNEDTSDAASEALAHFAYRLEDDFKRDHASQIIEALSKRTLKKSSLQLLFFLSCHEDFNELISEELLQKILEVSNECLENITDNRFKFLYIIRILGNINLNESIYGVIREHFRSKLDVIKKVLVMNFCAVNNSLFWLLGNLFAYCSQDDLFTYLLQ